MQFTVDGDYGRLGSASTSWYDRHLDLDDSAEFLSFSLLDHCLFTPQVVVLPGRNPFLVLHHRQ